MFGKSLTGILTLEVVSASPETLPDALVGANIPVFRLEPMEELTCRMDIRRRDLPALQKILDRRGASLRILQRRGFYWTAKSALHRPVLLAAFLLLTALTFFLPSRVLFVSVEGNSAVSDRQILSAAEEAGIRFGSSRKLVRSEQVKNRLLSAVPRLQWAGVNTVGCTAVISVRERTEETGAGKTSMVSSILAERDGYILSATVTGGTLAVQPGEAVTRGQLLISGFTDCGFCIRATRAEGEILAQTSRDLLAVTPESRLTLQTSPETKYKISLLLGKKRINLLKDSRISHTGCGRMYTEYYVSLPGGFSLPLGISVDRYRDHTWGESRLSQADAEELLQEVSDNCIRQQMIAGQILQKQQRIVSSGELYRLESRYVCREIIGREYAEQIGDINEQGS